MIQTVNITSMDDILKLLEEQEYNSELKLNRSVYLYRGLPDVNFKLVTSLERNCGEKKEALEMAILNNFLKYAEIEDPTIKESVWRQMILGRHHGLPTRLLDWSHSPLIGLHFAVTESDLSEMDARDCVVWRIDMNELRAFLPEKYRLPIINKRSVVYTVDLLNAVASTLKQYDDDMQGNSMVVIEPPSIDPRIVNQFSFFSVIPNGMDDIEEFFGKTNNTVRYVIDRKLRWRVRDMLDQLNINERIVYPGLDGLTKWIARHYYVRT